MAISQEEIITQLSQMTVVDLLALKKALEEKWDVKAAAPAAAMMMAAPAAGGGAAAVEQTEFTVELTAAGDKKLDVVKAVKEKLGLGLKEAKDLVDAAPKVLKENVAKAEAEEIQKALEGLGAKVTLK